MQREKQNNMLEIWIYTINALGNVVEVKKNPFHPLYHKPTLAEVHVCLGFGTWDL